MIVDLKEQLKKDGLLEAHVGMKDKYIGITDNRLLHLRGVAERCYEIAKAEGFSEPFCRKMYVLGFNHDIGYRFSVNKSSHPIISADMLGLIGVSTSNVTAILGHGSIVSSISDDYCILNIADLTVGPQGQRMTALERLAELKSRNGNTKAYDEMKHLIEFLSNKDNTGSIDYAKYLE